MSSANPRIPLHNYAVRVLTPDGRIGDPHAERTVGGRRQIEVIVPEDAFWHAWYWEDELTPVKRNVEMIRQERLL